MSAASCPKSDPEFVNALREFLGLDPLYYDASKDRLLRQRDFAIERAQAEEARRAWAEFERWRDKRRAARAAAKKALDYACG